MLRTIAQVGIFVFGTSSILLLSYKNKWGTVLGIISQPFWFTAAILDKQWGVLLTNVIYLIVWIIGFYNWFIKKEGEYEPKK